jgi:hypothetical protein
MDRRLRYRLATVGRSVGHSAVPVCCSRRILFDKAIRHSRHGPSSEILHASRGVPRPHLISCSSLSIMPRPRSITGLAVRWNDAETIRLFVSFRAVAFRTACRPRIRSPQGTLSTEMRMVLADPAQAETIGELGFTAAPKRAGPAPNIPGIPRAITARRDIGRIRKTPTSFAFPELRPDRPCRM